MRVYFIVTRGLFYGEWAALFRPTVLEGYGANCAVVRDFMLQGGPGGGGLL